MPPATTEPATTEPGTTEPGTAAGPEAGLLLMLHAAGSSPRALERLARALAPAGLRTVAPRIAIGGTGEGDGDPFAAAVAGVGELLEGAGEGRRVLIGHSMGGLVALKALAGGGRADALVLYEPITLALLDANDPDDRVELDWDRAVIAGLEAGVAAGAVEAGVRRFIEAYGEVAWPVLPAAVRAELAGQAPALLAAARATHGAQLASEALRGLAVPTLLLTGTGSPPLLGRMARRLAALLPMVETVSIEGAGHMGPIAAAGPVAEAVLAFLARHGGRRR